MFPRDRTNNQYVALAAGIAVLLIVGGIVLLMSASSSDSASIAGTTGAASDDSGFPIWIFGGLIPALLVPIMAARANRHDDEKAKNKWDDPTFDKAKREDVHYEVGPDGELVEVFDDDDELSDYENSR